MGKRTVKSPEALLPVEQMLDILSRCRVQPGGGAPRFRTLSSNAFGYALSEISGFAREPAKDGSDARFDVRTVDRWCGFVSSRREGRTDDPFTDVFGWCSGMLPYRTTQSPKIPANRKPTRGLEPRTPSLRVMTMTPKNPCNLRFTAFAGGLEPAMNPLLHRHG